MTAQDNATRHSFWERLQRIDLRWIYLVVWLVVMVPLIKPFPVKPLASPPVQQMFSFIDTMPEDKALIRRVTPGCFAIKCRSMPSGLTCPFISGRVRSYSQHAILRDRLGIRLPLGLGEPD